MSAIGTKQTYCVATSMSAFGGRADIEEHRRECALDSRTSLTEEVALKACPLDDTIARILGQFQYTRYIDTGKTAAPLLRPAGDEHGVDMARIHHTDYGAGRVVQRPNIQLVGLEQYDIGLLAGRQRADFILEPGAARALDRGEFQHLAAGEQRRQVLLTIVRALEQLRLSERRLVRPARPLMFVRLGQS